MTTTTAPNGKSKRKGKPDTIFAAPEQYSVPAAEHVPVTMAVAFDARCALQRLEMQLAAAFPERDEVIPTLTAALVAGEHVLLLGPPGTAKSDLARTFAKALSAPCFTHLLGRYTTPDELFGPYSLKGLESDRLTRKTAGRLPEAEVAFLDEVFKGSTAILNALLTAINEREMDDDGGRKQLPLRLVVGASNELPDDDDEALHAFDDRFVIRHQVRYLSEEGNRRALLEGTLPAVTATVSMAEVDVLADVAKRLPMRPDVVSSLLAIADELRGKGVRLSDRKLKKATAVLRAHAVLQGATAVQAEHLAILESMLWTRPDEKPLVAEAVARHVAPWLRDIREATAAIDEQVARFREAMKKDSGKDAIHVFADAAAHLKRLKAEVLDRLAEESPEARDDVARLNARCSDLSKEMVAAVTVLGGL